MAYTQNINKWDKIQIVCCPDCGGCVAAQIKRDRETPNEQFAMFVKRWKEAGYAVVERRPEGLSITPCTCEKNKTPLNK